MVIEKIEINNNSNLQDRMQFYFKELVDNALKHQNFDPQESSVFYIVNLLAYAIKTDNIFYKRKVSKTVVYDRLPKLFPELKLQLKIKKECVEYDKSPLGTEFLTALQLPTSQKYVALKKIGDYLLFRTGIFPESFNRGSVKIDYYISLGSNAYGALSWSDNDIFNELSNQFSSFCETLWIVKSGDKKNNDLLDKKNDLENALFTKGQENIQ